jgi:replicative DNA helicase
MNQLTDIPLPDAPEIEALILGSLLANNSQSMPLDVILSNLEPTDFALERNRSVFRLITQVHAKGQIPGIATVWTEAQSNKVGLSQGVLGGISYLVSLSDGIPQLESFDSHMGILREKAMLRSLIEKTDAITRRAYSGESVVALVAEMQAIGETVKTTGGKSSLMEVEDILEECGVEELLTPKNKRGIEPPIPWLAEHLRFEPKSLTTLAARPSVGKSAMAVQIMHEAASRRYRTVLASLEMHNTSILRRMIGQQGRVNTHRLKIGISDREGRTDAANALWRLAEMKDLMLFDDCSANSIPALNRMLHQLKLEQRPARFLIIDYLQLMQGAGKFGNRTEEVSSLSRGLKQIATKFDIPVLALSQLSRKGEETNREPILSDLRESGSIEQDADNVIFLHRLGDKKQEKQNIRLILAKQRDGQTGECDLVFTRRYTRFDQDGSGNGVAA